MRQSRNSQDRYERMIEEHVDVVIVGAGHA